MVSDFAKSQHQARNGYKLTHICRNLIIVIILKVRMDIGCESGEKLLCGCASEACHLDEILQSIASDLESSWRRPPVNDFSENRAARRQETNLRNRYEEIR